MNLTMLDIKYILANKDEYAEVLKNRHHDFNLDVLVELDAKRRKIIGETEELKAKRNEGSKKIGNAKNNPGLDINALKSEIKAIGDKIKELDAELAETEETLNGHLMTLPNKLSDTTTRPSENGASLKNLTSSLNPTGI